jgi:Family of unknown function (DUF6496)
MSFVRLNLLDISRSPLNEKGFARTNGALNRASIALSPWPVAKANARPWMPAPAPQGWRFFDFRLSVMTQDHDYGNCLISRLLVVACSHQELLMATKKRKYSRTSQSEVRNEMHRYKKGVAKSGKSGKGGKVKSRKQAIAIGLSKARKKGEKVPEKK